MVKKDSNLGDVILDSNNLKFSYNNKIIDSSGLNDVKKDIGRKFAGTLPGKLLKYTDQMSIKEPGIINYFDRGTTAPILAGLAGDKSNIIEKNYMKILSDFYSVNKDGSLTKENLGDDLYTISSKHGTMPRLMNKMFGEGAEREGTNRVTKWLDFNTSNESNLIDDAVRGTGFLGKVARKRFGGSQYNIIDRALNSSLAEENPLDYRNNLKDLNYVMSSITKTPKKSTLIKFRDSISKESSKEILDALINGNTDDMVNAIKKNSGAIKNKDLLKLAKTGSNNREAAASILSITSTGLTPQKNIKTYDEMLKREAFKDVMFSEIFNEKTGVKNHNKMALRLRQAGVEGVEYENAKHLSNWMTLQFEGKLFNDDSLMKNKTSIEDANNAALSLLNIQRKEDSLPINAEFVDNFSNGIKKIREDYTSVTTRTIDRNRPGEEIRADETNAYVLMRKAYKGKEYATDMIKNINDFEKMKASSNRFASQFIAGTHDPNNVTNYTMLPYFFTERLVDPFNKIGLGLSSENMTSTAKMWQSIMMKRVMPLAAGITAFSYLNDTTKQFTGTSITGAMAQGVGNVDHSYRRINSWRKICRSTYSVLVWKSISG